jgi:hypothetical protein
MASKKHFNILKGYALSNDDIEDALDLEPTNIFSSDKLEDAYSIDELLDRKGRGVLFFRTENKNTGHWIAVLKQGDTIEIFDPYGFHPEDFKQKLGAGNGLNPDMSILEDLISRSGYKMIVNNVRNQSLSPDIATCGRHSVMRLMFRNLNNKQYNQFLKQIKKEDGITPDDLATGMTLQLIGK